MAQLLQFQLNKLVRDKLPTIIKQRGAEMLSSVLNEADYREALKAKLLEETQEVVEAATTTEYIEELADVLEVLHAMAAAHNISFVQVEARRQAKHDSNGGFADRVYGLALKVNEDHPDIGLYLGKYPPEKITKVSS